MKVFFMTIVAVILVVFGPWFVILPAIAINHPIWSWITVALCLSPFIGGWWWLKRKTEELKNKPETVLRDVDEVIQELKELYEK